MNKYLIINICTILSIQCNHNTITIESSQKGLPTIICDTLQAPTRQYPILSYEEYAKNQHPSPYLFTLSKANQSFFYFGANHSCDPLDAQYPQLEEFWHKFLHKTNRQNCIVLIEGSKRRLHQTKEGAITSAGGEGGLMTLLAFQEHIPVVCPEPEKDFLRQELLKQFSEDVVMYRNFAHCVQQFNRYRQNDPNLDFHLFYQEYNSLPLQQMKKIHENLFGISFDPYDELFFYTITNPVVDDTIINTVCRQASIIRDQYIVDQANILIQQGKNIFIVYGHTHVVMQEQAIRKLWDELVNSN